MVVGAAVAGVPCSLESCILTQIMLSAAFVPQEIIKQTKMTEKRQLPTNKLGEKDHHGALIEAQVLAGHRKEAEERAIKSISIQ